MTDDDTTEPAEQLDLPSTSQPRLASESAAQREADVHSGRAFEWQVGQDAYERWLNDIAP